ncbi:MAG: DUF2442 domain-containing protein [Rhodospirillaceae bacterium]|nr:DUF2442 domain-containing protein [Rhodospirillaceae bacterium]
MKTSDRSRTITEVKARPPARLSLTWSDGTRAMLDMNRFMIGRGAKVPRAAAAFAKVRVGEWGHSVEWSGGAALGADVLWLETLSAIGRDDTRAFMEWRLRHGLSLAGAASALGVSRRMVAYYSNGDKPVPRPILLACKGWEVSVAA